jgi:hypothetical protein
MSIKIYDGVKFTTNSLAEIKAVFKKCAAGGIFHDVLAELLLTGGYDLVRHYVFKNESFDNSLKMINNIIMNEIFDNEKDRYSLAGERNRRNFVRENEIALGVSSAPDGNLLGLLFGGSMTRKLFMDSGIAIPYGYWDNTDPDETATEEEWEQRKKDWSHVLLDDSGVPSNEMFCIVAEGIDRLTRGIARWDVDWLEALIGKLEYFFSAEKIHKYTLVYTSEKIVDRLFRENKRKDPEHQYKHSSYMEIKEQIETKYAAKMTARAKRYLDNFNNKGGTKALFEPLVEMIERKKESNV